MHLCFKIVKFLLQLMSLYHHQEPSTTAHAASGYRVILCWLRPQHCSVDTVSISDTDSSNGTGLEDTTNTKSHGSQRLHVQWWKAPEDGHNSVRNM
jgi:hypothetical protein